MKPVLTREEYLQLRGSARQKATLKAVREGDEQQKRSLLQMNYSCLPGEDGALRGATRLSTTVGMDVDHIKAEEMTLVKDRILEKKDELGLLMLERSARGAGYHLVFHRRAELSQEENLQWASELLGVAFDAGAKDITRVFFTTSDSKEELIYLNDEVFAISEAEADEVRSKKEEVRNEKCSRLSPQTSCSARQSSNEFGSASMVFAPPSVPPLSGDRNTSGGCSMVNVQCSMEFKGIPYSSIIAEYWRQTGGEPTEGERNKRLHQLAANLRAVCDNSEAWLLELMPRYGLSEEEMRSIIHSACKEPTKGSRLMDRIVAELDEERKTKDDNENEENNVQCSMLNVQWKKLPLGLRESLSGVPSSMHMPVLCGVLPIAAAYADQVEVEYCDGNLQHLGLMSIIRGEQASNKSVVKNAVDVWKRQLDEEDALARKREEVWKERRKSRKANEKAPDDPKVLIRMVPVTVSCSTLLKRFKNAEGHTLYSFGEELDTLRKTNGAGSWSSKYDIYRLSFDKGEWGQDYNSDQAESGVVKVAYNWTMLGTNGAMRKCFKSDNIENGLSSRVLVAEMPDSAFSKMPRFTRRTPEEEAAIQEAVTRLRSYSGLIDTPRLRKAIGDWVEEKRVEAAKDIDRVKDTYRKRAAVIGFRCGVVFHLLSGCERESKACLDFALMMADYCLTQQMNAFGEALQSQYVNAGDECRRYGSNHSVFDQLPPLFTMDDLRALKQGFCGEAALRKTVSRWCHDNWIEKSDRTHWRKVETL